MFFLIWTMFPQNYFTTEIGLFGSNIHKVYLYFFNLYIFKDNKKKNYMWYTK